jgi:hypothetical protein
MKVINFFGAPGVGKTTNALLLTAILKKLGIDTEISLEFVKEYIFTNNEDMIAFQNHIFSEQERKLRVFSKSNEVEFAIADSPLLLSAYYAPKDYAIYFKDLVFEIFNTYENINFFVNRNHSYSHQGRKHNEEESIFINKNIKAYLINNNIPFIEINSTDNLEDFVIPYLLENHRDKDYQTNKRDRNKEKELKSKKDEK